MGYPGIAQKWHFGHLPMKSGILAFWQIPAYFLATFSESAFFVPFRELWEAMFRPYFGQSTPFAPFSFGAPGVARIPLKGFNLQNL